MFRRDQILLEQAYESIASHWGSSKQPYWRPGSNPTVDLVLINKNKILLIKRGANASTEPNKWAIPGGFIDTTSKKGEPFRLDIEQPKEAAIREVSEETRLNLSHLKNLENRMVTVGVYEGDKRDPRDNEEAWSKSYVFALSLTEEDNVDPNEAEGSDDASDAKWFDLNKLPRPLAFDHEKIINDALTKLSL
jgi:8-oxo-dGTP diphosphatase